MFCSSLALTAIRKGTQPYYLSQLGWPNSSKLGFKLNFININKNIIENDGRFFLINMLTELRK